MNTIKLTGGFNNKNNKKNSYLMSKKNKINNFNNKFINKCFKYRKKYTKFP